MNTFETILDFMRFAITEANKAELYFGHGTDNAEDDMRALILESLHLPFNIDRQYWLSRLTSAEKTLLTERIQQRVEHFIPVPYITNKAYFCDLPFYVDERVLIPRSPIAELIKRQFSPWLQADKVHNILELCTGSGCIAIACAYAFPEAQVDASDISWDALQVAAYNCEQHGLEGEVELIQSDCWEAIPEKRYDLIIANPPYVSDEEMADLPEEYLHEPDLALRAEEDGLAIVVKILQKAHDYLNEEGILVVEVGNSEYDLIAAFPDLPCHWVEFEHGGHGVFVLTAQQLGDYFTG